MNMVLTTDMGNSLFSDSHSSKYGSLKVVILILR